MSYSKYNLKGKIALITGSSRGIGRATALRLAEEGANVVIDYLRHKENAEETVSQIRKMNRESVAVQADVGIFKEAKKLVNTAVKKFGQIDILVNNAGIVEDRTLLKMNLEQWRSVLQTNLFGVFYCSKLAAKEMVKRNSGRIINIASIVGQTGNFGQTNYSASKAGVIGFTKSLAHELATKGITVNAVSPGFTDTDMVRKLPEAVRTALLQRIPLKRFGRPEEIAEMIVFLASDRSSYITGQVFNVNGGLLM
jgi:3-oxoacyl-[acyl-carrier protein] reductase